MKRVILFLGLVVNGVAFSQNPLNVFTKREKGIEVVQKDSLFSIRFQFRMQNRAGYLSKSDEYFTPESFEFRVRRLRNGHAGVCIQPKMDILCAVIVFMS